MTDRPIDTQTDGWTDGCVYLYIVMREGRGRGVGIFDSIH